MEPDAHNSTHGPSRPNFRPNLQPARSPRFEKIPPEYLPYPLFTDTKQTQSYIFDNHIPDASIHYDQASPQEDVNVPTSGAPPMLPTRYPESSQRTSIRDGQLGSEESGKYGRYFNSGSLRPAAFDDDMAQFRPLRVNTSQGTDRSTTDPYIDIYSSSPGQGNNDHHRTSHQTPSDSPSFLHEDMHDGYLIPSSPSHLQRFLTFKRPPGDFERAYVLPSVDSGVGSSQPNEPKYSSQANIIATHSPTVSSIPMSNNVPDWTQSVLGRAFEAQQTNFASRELSGSPARTTPESESSITHSYNDSYSGTIPPTTASSFRSSKKKSKMHECEICGKMFPRPSGLRTHMNTHNNVKPFPCVFPGCSRSFAVRSNAKRHLRTHGVLPTLGSDATEPPYVVDFSTPMILPPTPPFHQTSKAPYKLRWMPPSLMTRTNAESLKSISDPEYYSDDESGDDGDEGSRSALSIPLCAVVPSSCATNSDDQYEERNSYIDTGSHPYHPTQFFVLPGPAVLAPRHYTGSLKNSIPPPRNHLIIC